MTETLIATELPLVQKSALPEVSPATHEDIIAYLRRSHKLAEISALAEHDALILDVCDRLGITVSDEELQVAGDAFRLEHRLLGASETLIWLQKQRITVEDWTQGIRVTLLTNKLKEYLFGDSVDAHYLSNRDDYKRVALSQILVSDVAEALKITYAIRESNASFCALALEHSKGKQSKENGGFVGICFLTKLLPQIVQAITNAKEGEIVLRLEKWFSLSINEAREQVLESLLLAWLQTESNLNSHHE